MALHLWPPKICDRCNPFHLNLTMLRLARRNLIAD